MPRRFLLLVLVIILAGLLYFFRSLFVVALVNGQPITRLSLLQELEKQGGKSTLNSLVTKSLILQEAKKQKITVTAQEVDQSLTQLEENLAAQGQDLNQLLEMQGTTRDSLKDQFRIQTIVEKIVGKDIQVTDQEVKDFAEENKSSFPKDAKVEEVSASARQQLRRQKINEKASAWLDSLHKNAKIQYFLQF
jgi:foldase protein PrsA